MNRVKGVVKWFNDAKGFGFISVDDKHSDVFLHYSSIVTDGFKTVTEGAIVELDLVVGSKGAQAFNVVTIKQGLPHDDECDHSDHDDLHCLDCGEDLTEYLAGRAEHYSDMMRDR